MSVTAQFTLEGFGGTVFRPGDGDYEDARMVFNGMIDRHPAIIARCASVDDVVAVVDLARSNDLPLSVYGGGHGVTGSAVVDAGVCLDLRGMRGVTVDPAASTASVEGGAIWGDVDAATQEHGLAVTGGRVSTTGVGGLDPRQRQRVARAQARVRVRQPLERAGRHGRRRRRHGVGRREPRPVLGPAGRRRQLRRGHPFRLPAAPGRTRSCFGGMLMYPAAMAGELVRFYREFIATAPDEVGTGLAFITAPPEDFVPEPVRGQPVIGDRVLLRRSGRGR